MISTSRRLLVLKFCMLVLILVSNYFFPTQQASTHEFEVGFTHKKGRMVHDMFELISSLTTM